MKIKLFLTSSTFQPSVQMYYVYVYVCMHTTPNGSTYRLETTDYSYGNIIMRKLYYLWLHHLDPSFLGGKKHHTEISVICITYVTYIHATSV